MKPKHPMQPVVLAEDKVVRFKQNVLVRYLVDCHPDGLNALARLPSPPYGNEDWEQLAQLIGYSVSGFSDLSYARGETVKRADAEAARILAARKTPKARKK